jgi:hypothetical protein
VTGVAGDFGDHAEVDKSQAHGADDVMFDQVVELVTVCQFVGLCARRAVFGDDVGKGFIVGNGEAAVAASGVAVTCLSTACTISARLRSRVF